MASNAPHRSSVYDSSLISVDYQPPKYDPYNEHDEPFVPPKDTSSHHAGVADIPQSIRSPSPSSMYSSSTWANTNTLNANGTVTSPKTSRPLSEIREDDGYNPYSARDPHSLGMYDDDDRNSLVHNAVGMGMAEKAVNSREDLEYQDPYGKGGQSAPPAKPDSMLQRFFGGRYPIEQRIENKKRGIGRQRYPFLVWLLTVIMSAVFIYELVKNSQEQGTPVSFKPTVNPMLGPSESCLIFVGARFRPCMTNVPDVPLTLDLPCMNDTANPPDRTCPLSELCGFGGIPQDETPNQWFRFITPIFLHAGFIHIILNMIAQMVVSAQLEREMGTGGFFLVFFAAGIFGNILGGNFALSGIPSVGASGAIFGTVAVNWVDLLAHWKYQYKPKTKLIFMIVEVLLAIGMGYIPYVDNFAHLGGFLMGLLVGMVFYPIISETKRHKMIVWGFRIAAIPLIIVLFVVLTKNFYTTDPSASCGWCRYLSCIPTSSNNHCKGTGITETTTTTTSNGATTTSSTPLFMLF